MSIGNNCVKTKVNLQRFLSSSNGFFWLPRANSKFELSNIEWSFVKCSIDSYTKWQYKHNWCNEKRNSSSGVRYLVSDLVFLCCFYVIGLFVSSEHNVFSSPCSLIDKFYVRSLPFIAIEITHKQHLNLPLGRSNSLSLFCWLLRSHVWTMDFCDLNIH